MIEVRIDNKKVDLNQAELMTKIRYLINEIPNSCKSISIKIVDKPVKKIKKGAVKEEKKADEDN